MCIHMYTYVCIYIYMYVYIHTYIYKIITFYTINLNNVLCQLYFNIAGAGGGGNRVKKLSEPNPREPTVRIWDLILFGKPQSAIANLQISHGFLGADRQHIWTQLSTLAPTAPTRHDVSYWHFHSMSHQVEPKVWSGPIPDLCLISRQAIKLVS